MRQLYFITGNKGKLSEIENRLKPFNIKIVQKDLGYPEIQADTLEDVAKYGVDHVKSMFVKPFILEDAGLFIDELKGFPGVYSKYVFYTVGLLNILKLMKNKKNRYAVFRSVYAFYDKNLKTNFFIGECHGEITTKIRGSAGFGYDPIFQPKDSKKTFAEMTIEEKNIYSHRGKALDKLVEFLIKNYDLS